jgi:predicted Mrr-cat superfamily restriction endonuclease
MAGIAASIGASPDQRFRYVKAASGAEDVLALSLVGDDGTYSVVVRLFATNSTDTAEFTTTLVLRRASAVWSFLQTITQPGLVATSGAVSWDLSIGAIVSDSITFTATSPSGVAWTATIDAARTDAG